MTQLLALADRIRDDIDGYCQRTYGDEHRSHLGASVIGHDCNRHIWYAFRWAKKELFSGRMLRLFNRGHLEEQRWIGWLRGIGFQIWEVDNDGKQFRIWGAKGHYGGASDSVGISPYPQFPEPMLVEFKTHNKKSFTNLVSKKVRISKPRHYAQMCQYGRAYGFKYAIYCASCKDDDDIYIEAVELDYTQASDDYKRANDIVFSAIAPPKISLQPSYYECKMCAFLGVCHYNEPLERNCRSCANAKPVDDAQWRCEFHGAIIPKDYIPQGCQSWKPIA